MQTKAERNYRASRLAVRRFRRWFERHYGAPADFPWYVEAFLKDQRRLAEREKGKEA